VERRPLHTRALLAADNSRITRQGAFGYRRVHFGGNGLASLREAAANPQHFAFGIDRINDEPALDIRSEIGVARKLGRS